MRLMLKLELGRVRHEGLWKGTRERWKRAVMLFTLYSNTVVHQEVVQNRWEYCEWKGSKPKVTS